MTEPEIPRCTGTNGAGARCKNRPIRGGTVCSTHGGSAPQVRAAADRRLAEAEAARAVATFGLRRDVDPLSALLEEVQWTAGHVEWLRIKVQEHDDEGLVWGLVEERTGVGAQGPIDQRTEKAGASVWLGLYQAERKHLVAVCGEAIRSGVAERQVRLAERQGQLVAGVLGAVLGALLAQLEAAGVQETVRAAWPGWVSEIVPRELRALGAGEGSGT